MYKKVLESIKHLHDETHEIMLSLTAMVLRDEIDVDEDLQKVNDIICKVNDLLTDAEILCIKKINKE